MKRFFCILLLLVAFCAEVSAQSFTETLLYLNDKLNSEASRGTQSQGQKIIWKVTTDGRLITKLIHRDGYTLDTKSYYLKTLCSRLECSELSTRPDLLLNRGPETFLIIKTTNGAQLIIDVIDEEAGKESETQYLI